MTERRCTAIECQPMPRVEFADAPGTQQTGFNLLLADDTRIVGVLQVSSDDGARAAEIRRWFKDPSRWATP